MPFEDDIRDLDNFEPVAKIVVIGVGGAGNNAVNRMIDENIQNVEFYVVNTDKQALASSKAAHRIVIGEEITKGLGAGGDPAMGKAAAEASKETIQKIVEGADMVFVAAGMGKGTGTGAAPVIARIAKDAGCLTVAIVTRPFTFEGPKRIENSVQGLNALKDAVDSIIIVSNDKLLMSAGNAPINMAFSESDAILCQSVRTVADLILVPAQMNLDFA
ncbi:MAG: cell division protein FtsZ, partial [Candidatus Enteromonas sp.]|nr:cell division protein FtsZ [Candidatus Enteromonas sp.]